MKSILRKIRDPQVVSISVFKARVKVTSHRLQLFAAAKEGCPTCVGCGLTADFFAVEGTGQNPSFHLNLYGIGLSGEEVLFTKDHIIPKSKNGPTHPSNLQVMCAPCNVAKGNK